MNSLNDHQVVRSIGNDGITSVSPALHGALSAFTKSPARLDTSSHTSSGVDAARLSKSSPSTQAGDVRTNTRANGKNLPPPMLSIRGKSPSNIAAVAAASRSQTLPLPPRYNGAREPRTTNQEIPSSDIPQEDILPAAGTVGGLRGRFENLSSAATAASETTRHSNALSTPLVTPAIYDVHPSGSRPKLGLDVDLAHDVVATQRIPAEIHSPKPVRRITAIAPFESAIEKSKDEAALYEVLAQGRPTDFLPNVSSSPQSEGFKKPAPPPPRRSVNKNIAPEPVKSSHGEPDKQTRRDRASSTTALLPSRRPGRTPLIPKRGTNLVQKEFEIDARRVDSLANAIVGAHLASSRTSSPAKAAAPPSLFRHHTDVLHPTLHVKTPKPESRTPSPKKGMRHTLREPPPQPEEEKTQQWHRQRSHFHLKKHPNKHHEGTRKRWRDEITEIERKRYEGVWAANRGMYVNLTPVELVLPGAAEKAKGYVSALVVKDIWSRSRLPSEELEDIWNLVDREKAPRLSRESFVVGMWLIDQRLKGRKLPTKVGESVWHSVVGIYGLKVPKIRD